MMSKSVFLCLTAMTIYGASVQAFDCPEPFGIYSDPADNQYYYVCENKLPLRGDCDNSIFVPEVCNKTSSVNSTCATNSGNFGHENGTISKNDSSVDYENFEESNCTSVINDPSELNINNTSETNTTNMSWFNQTDIYFCNETLTLETDFAKSRYIVKCGANATNENETNSMNDTSIDYEKYEDLFNITSEGNGTYKIEIFSHNVTYYNESDSFSSNETYPEIVSMNSGHLANENLKENNQAEKNATSKKNNQPDKKTPHEKSTSTTQQPWSGTTIMASGSNRSNSNFECPSNDASSVNSTRATNSGNFGNENGIIFKNDSSVDSENFEESNCTSVINDPLEQNMNNTSETNATNMSWFNQTDIYFCNETLTLEMDVAKSRYIVKCGANATNENETNSMNDTSIDNEKFEDLFNITSEGNGTYKIEIFSHNVTYLNESDSFSSNETYPEIISVNSVNLTNENLKENNHAEKNATSKKNNKTDKKTPQEKSTSTTQQPWRGTTFMASGSNRSNSNFECPSNDGLYPDNSDKTCQAYWDCKNNIPVHKTCKGVMVFSPATTACEDYADCNN